MFGVILIPISRIRTEYGEILRILCIQSRYLSVFTVRMQENADQNNSKYGHFLRSVKRFHLN